MQWLVQCTSYWFAYSNRCCDSQCSDWFVCVILVAYSFTAVVRSVVIGSFASYWLHKYSICCCDLLRNHWFGLRQIGLGSGFCWFQVRAMAVVFKSVWLQLCCACIVHSYHRGGLLQSLRCFLLFAGFVRVFCGVLLNLAVSCWAPCTLAPCFPCRDPRVHTSIPATNLCTGPHRPQLAPNQSQVLWAPSWIP